MIASAAGVRLSSSQFHEVFIQKSRNDVTMQLLKTIISHKNTEQFLSLGVN